MSAKLLNAPKVFQRSISLFIITVVYLVTINVGIGVGLAATARGWQADTTERVIVTIPANKADAEDTKLVLNLIRQWPGVTNVEPLATKELQELLTPFISDEKTRSMLPLPMVIDVYTISNTAFDIKGLRNAVTEKMAGAQVDKHSDWLANEHQLITKVVFLTWWGMVLMFVVLTTGIVMAVRGLLSVQKETVDLLLVLGAPSRYISNLTTQLIRRMSIPNIFIGWLLGISTLAVIIFLAREIFMRPDVIKLWAAGAISAGIILLIVPIAAFLFAVLAARMETARIFKNK